MQWLNRSKLNRGKDETPPITNALASNNAGSVLPEKHRHPKILLFDLPESVELRLKELGYSVITGKLGGTYSVTKKAGITHLLPDWSLPANLAEQDVIVIDTSPLILPEEKYFKSNARKIEVGVDEWYVGLEKGFISTQLFASVAIADDCSKVLNAGGVIVLFANSIANQKFSYGRVTGEYMTPFWEKDVVHATSLSCLDINNQLRVTVSTGENVRLSPQIDRNSVIASFISKHIQSVKYKCVIHTPDHSESEWVELVENKFDEAVGVALCPNRNRKGWVFILPDFEDKATFLSGLINEVLPQCAPSLFPHLVNQTWTKESEYQLLSIARIKNEIWDIQRKAEAEILRLEIQKELEEAETVYLYDLATETGERLVEAVSKAFGILGFKKIVDVDQQLKEQGVLRQNREDLQIGDYEEDLICEIKGINNFPADDDALAVMKYVQLRMKEWGRTNVRGLSVINHQRSLPPHDRDHKMPFRQEILDTAQQIGIGLITGWDLHRLTRSFIQNNWSHDNIRRLFYQSGRIDPIPSHYEYVGVIERYIENLSVVGINLTAGVLGRGDRIAFELPVEFIEQLCESIQNENQEVEQAQIGMLVGVKTCLTKQQAKQGVRVFRLSA